MLTLWPATAIAAMSVWAFLFPVSAGLGKALDYPKDQLLQMAVELAAFVVLGILSVVALASTTVFYAVHIFTNRDLGRGKKVAWTAANVLLGPVAMPVYFYLYVVGRRESYQ